MRYITIARVIWCCLTAGSFPCLALSNGVAATGGVDATGRVAAPCGMSAARRLAVAGVSSLIIFGDSAGSFGSACVVGVVGAEVGSNVL